MYRAPKFQLTQVIIKIWCSPCEVFTSSIEAIRINNAAVTKINSLQETLCSCVAMEATLTRRISNPPTKIKITIKKKIADDEPTLVHPARKTIDKGTKINLPHKEELLVKNRPNKVIAIISLKIEAHFIVLQKRSLHLHQLVLSSKNSRLWF